MVSHAPDSQPCKSFRVPSVALQLFESAEAQASACERRRDNHGLNCDWLTRKPVEENGHTSQSFTQICSAGEARTGHATFEHTWMPTRHNSCFLPLGRPSCSTVSNVLSSLADTAVARGRRSGLGCCPLIAELLVALKAL